MIKRLLPLLFLILGPSRAFADRLGGLNANSQVLLTTQAAAGSITPGATFYIQNTNTLQTGATFYVSSGTIQGNQNFYLNGTGGSANTSLFPSFIPLPRSAGFGPQTQDALLYFQSNQSSGVGAVFTVVATTVPPASPGTYPLATEGQSAALALSPFGGSDVKGNITLSVNRGNQWIVNNSSVTISPSVVMSSYNCSGNTNSGKLTVTSAGLVVCADDISGGSGGSGSPLEVFNNFDSSRSSPTLSISASNAFRGSVNGSTYTFTMNTSSVTLLGPDIDLSGVEVSGILAAARFPALTGNVTTSAGSLTTTVVVAPSGSLQSGSTNYIQNSPTLVAGSSATVAYSYAVSSATMNLLTANSTFYIPGSTTVINGIFYSWPNAQASGTKILSNNGSGVLSWATDQSGGASTLPLIPGDTNYVQISTSAIYQTGAFRISSGTALTVYFSSASIGDAPSSSLSSNPLSVTGNSNNFYQINVMNRSSGNNASSDYVATNDLGSDTSGYVNLGINGSGNNQATFNIAGSSDSYLYSSNRSLAIGTGDSGSDAMLRFFTGGTTLANQRMFITNTGTVAVVSPQFAIGGTTATWTLSGTNGQALITNGATPPTFSFSTIVTPLAAGVNVSTFATANGNIRSSTVGVTEVAIATVTITPTSTSSKIEITAYVTYCKDGPAAARIITSNLRRGTNATSTSNVLISSGMVDTFPAVANSTISMTVGGIDTPGSTSLQTYTLNAFVNAGNSTGTAVSFIAKELAGGGIGDAVLAGTQTFSGANIFRSSTTFLNVSSFSIVGATVTIGQSNVIYSSNTFQVGTSTTMAWNATAGHLEFHSSTTPAVSSCGTGGPTTADSGSMDIVGSVTTGTLATACTITFSMPFINPPKCQVAGSSTVSFPSITSVSKTAITFGISGSVNNDVLTWFCPGIQ